MNTQEKTLEEQFHSLRIATYRYLREQYRKAAEETSKESRKEIIDKIFACLSEEEQKTMRSYLERVIEALKQETKEGDDSNYDFPFHNGHMGFYPCMGGFRRMDHWFGAYGHGGNRMDNIVTPF